MRYARCACASSSVSHFFGVLAHCRCQFLFFFFNDTATTEIYTLSLHDALPILRAEPLRPVVRTSVAVRDAEYADKKERSEEHTSELQSQSNLVCRLLLEKKKHVAWVLRSMPSRGKYKVSAYVGLPGGTVGYGLA